MDDSTLEAHIEECVVNLRKIYGDLPEDQLLRMHSEKLFRLEMVMDYCRTDDEGSCHIASIPPQRHTEHHHHRGIRDYLAVIEHLFTHRRTEEPDTDYHSFFASASRGEIPDRAQTFRPQRKYNNESPPLWMIPIPEDRIEAARSCNHRIMMSRKRGKATIYNCARCGFWLDTSLACLEDAMLMWIDHVDAWSNFWKRQKKA